MTRIKAIIGALALGSTMTMTPALAGNGLFDVHARKAALATPAYAAQREACMVRGFKYADKPLSEPIIALKSTKGYGSDNASQQFAMRVMVLAGRSLAGDAASTQELIALLDTWSTARAFEKSEETHDAYYALKRTLLPTIVAYNIVSPDMTPEKAKQVKVWLNRLVRRMDKKFNGVVDENNHRYLADSVLMVWGNIIDDPSLYNKGKLRVMEALRATRDDGTLPLETRRGARSNWYMRHALTSLTVMAEASLMRGENLYNLAIKGKTLDSIAAGFLNGMTAPASYLAYASENYKPGPSDDYVKQDNGILNRRGHERHYFAFSEAYAKHSRDAFVGARMRAALQRHGADERPLIDEYVGGNATCFWWEPDA